jgi:hypothetical protein
MKMNNTTPTNENKFRQHEIPANITIIKLCVYNSDGVQLTADGHKTLANRVIGCLKTLLATPKKKTGQSTYFWRGFRSRRSSLTPRNHVGKANWNSGSIVTSNHAASGSRGRARGGPSRGGSSSISRGYHPYRRW